jgi:purine-binding chemotaxis protein CheW
MSAPVQAATSEEEGGTISLLMFRVGSELFALDLASVEEAVEFPALHGVPTRERHLRGVVDWRGRLLPEYSPSRVLGLESAADAITLVLRDGARHVGLAVDEVEDVLELAAGQLRPAPVRGAAEPVLTGLARHDGALVAILDAAALVEGCAVTSQEES